MMSMEIPRHRRGAGRSAAQGALFSAILCLPAVAFASGLDSPLVGSTQSGPTTVDPAAIHYNPAQLAFIDAKRVDALGGLALVIGHVRYERERRGVYQTPDTLQFKTPLSPENIDPTKTGWAPPVTATPVAPTGDLFLAAPVLKDRLTVGLGAYVPYAAALNFPKEGAQAWQLQQAFIVASFVTASAGVKVTKKLAFGAGLSYVGGLAELSKLQDFGSLEEFRRAFANEPINQPNDFGPNAPTEVRELDVLSRPISIKRAVSHGITFNIGAAYRPTDSLSLGLNYQHGASMNYKGQFALDMNDDLFTQDLAAQGLKYKPLVKGDASLAFSLPKRITLGAAYDVSPKFRVDGFLSYVTYSDVEAFTVVTRSPDLAQPKLGISNEVQVRLDRNWNDTMWIEAAGRYRLTDKMLVSAGLGYQSPASPDSTIDVASPDGHRLIGSLGGVYEATSWLSLLGDARLQGILPRTVTGSAHDLGNGRYTLFIAGVGGHLRAKF
jgi:long-chain fatty acid transport protein